MNDLFLMPYAVGPHAHRVKRHIIPTFLKIPLQVLCAQQTRPLRYAPGAEWLARLGQTFSPD